MADSRPSTLVPPKNDEKGSKPPSIRSEPRSSTSVQAEKPPLVDATRPHSGFFGRRKSALIVDDEKPTTITKDSEAKPTDHPPVSLLDLFRCVQTIVTGFSILLTRSL
jgi:hypothetical protein